MSADTVHTTADPAATTPPVQRTRRWLGPVLAVLAPTLVTVLHAVRYGRWLVDDAAITFAYARSVAEGAGPVLQPGAAPVEGYSDPAWLAVLAAGRQVGLFDRGAWFGVPDYVLFPKGVALLCCVGVFVALHRAAAALTSRPALVAGAAGTVVALVPSFVIWCFSGLENPLLALAVTSLAAVLVRAAAAGRLDTPRTALCCGLLAALAALTRPEGVLYAAAYPLVALLLVGRGTLRRSAGCVAVSIAVFAVPVGAHLLWRWREFHALVPNTALAKGQSLPGVADLTKTGTLLAYAGWFGVLLAVACVGVALVRSRPRAGLVALLVPLVLALVAFTVLAQDWMPQHRFATPIWPLAALAAAVGAAGVARLVLPTVRVAVAVLAVAAVAVSATRWYAGMSAFRAGPTVPVCVVAQQSWEYNGYARVLGVRDGSVLLPDIGATALTSELRVYDVVGLADRRFAGYWAAHDMAGLRDYVLDTLHPTFIHLHGAWALGTGLLADPRLTQQYDLIRTTPGGGQNLVRKDAVPTSKALAAVRAYATTAATTVHAATSAPRSSCGPTLTPQP